jgi:hypothetical protein
MGKNFIDPKSSEILSVFTCPCPKLLPALFLKSRAQSLHFGEGVFGSHSADFGSTSDNFGSKYLLW